VLFLNHFSVFFSLGLYRSSPVSINSIKSFIFSHPTHLPSDPKSFWQLLSCPYNTLLSSMINTGANLHHSQYFQTIFNAFRCIFVTFHEAEELTNHLQREAGRSVLQAKPFSSACTYLISVFDDLVRTFPDGIRTVLLFLTIWSVHSLTAYGLFCSF